VPSGCVSVYGASEGLPSRCVWVGAARGAARTAERSDAAPVEDAREDLREANKACGDLAT